MVLMNTLKLELALITLLCISATTLELPNRSQAPETTTTSAKPTTEVQTTTTTTQKLSAISSKPKTDNSYSNQNAEQKHSRGSTKYADYAYSTTEATKETISTFKQNSQQTKSAKLTTMRNDRSLSLNTDKYNSPEFHSENNIYPETQIADRKYEYGHLAELELTTPKDAFFDKKYRQIQDDISKSFNGMPTTDRREALEDKYNEMHEEATKTMLVELTTPKDEQFDSRHEEIREHLSKSLEHIDDVFDEKMKQTSMDTIEKPAVNDTELVSVRYRNIEANEAKIKNKLRKDYVDETGLQMQLTSKYHNNQTIDAPGIVANTIPTHKDSESFKKIDLDQGETALDRISIEKPEKDPSTLFHNKIGNEVYHRQVAEGHEEKPYEHKNIYVSKRGSTIQSGEQSIEKTLSTETGIPLDIYPSSSSNSNLKHSENDTFVRKTVKKDKVTNKPMKKELKTASDLDNIIPNYLTTNSSIKIETSTTSSLISESNKPAPQEFTNETFNEEDNHSTTLEILTSTESTVESTTENFSTVNFYDISDESDITSELPQETDSTSTKPTTYEDILYSELTTDKLPEHVTVEQNEDITTQNDENMGPSTTTLVTESHVSKATDMEHITFSYNNSKNEIGYSTEHVILDSTTNETTKINTFVNNTTENIPISATLSQVNTTTATNVKKNESVPSIINEVTKPSNSTMNAATNNVFPSTKSTNWDSVTENIMHGEEILVKENNTRQQSENDQTKQNEIACDRLIPEECENPDDSADYSDSNLKPNNPEEGNESDGDLEENEHNQHSHNDENKLPTTVNIPLPTETVRMTTQTPVSATSKIILITTTASSTTPDLLGTQIVRQIDAIDSNDDTKTESIVSSEEDTEEDGGNGGKIAAIVISTIGGICLLLLVALLIIMKKRQKRFNYGQRCRPVSLDAYSMDNVSIHNSTRRKGVLMTSKRSYGNPAFEDPTLPTHLLNISELLKFSNNDEGVKTEFERIPQVTTKTNELPEGCDVKNRYANIIPLPETRVFLSPIEGVVGSDYINANYVTGPQGARHYYIACQAPMQNTIEDFWRMIWEQQSKVVLMITHLYEGGVEKCIDYLPPSEVLDCHRLFGDFQVTLKKREVKDKYIISSLQLKNMVSNSWREVTHLWYMGWPEKGVPDEANSLIAFLIEARSCMKTGDNKVKETNNTNISNGLTAYMNPVIVHCSPGTGRTGTVIACDIAIREFELTRKVDIPKIVYRIRRDRASAVQTKEQYAYIYKVIHFYATKLTGGAFDSF